MTSSGLACAIDYSLTSWPALLRYVDCGTLPIYNNMVENAIRPISITMICMERSLNYVVFSEDGSIVARCLDVEVASDGRTEREAVANLKEALELFFEDHENALAELPLRTYQFGEVAVHV